MCHETDLPQELVTMAAIRFAAFDDEHVEEAATLLATRHAEHRRRQPLLPEVEDFTALLRSVAEGASGIVAHSGGKLVGYLIGTVKDIAGGAAVWCSPESHVASDPEHIDDLYAAAASIWVEAGHTRQFVFLPAGSDLIEAWFHLSFGLSGVLAIRDLSPIPISPSGSSIVVRPSAPDDLAAIARLAHSMLEVLRTSPSFDGRKEITLAELESEWSDLWSDGKFTHFVAELDGAVAGHILMYTRERDLRFGRGSIDLGNAATAAEFRGLGVGTAMTAHVIDWARQVAFTTMTTDWRTSNLLARHFWPKRGFEPAFVRLYRSIP